MVSAVLIENLKIEASHLCALRECFPKNDVRHYLFGMLLEIGKTKYCLVTTDGHCLAMAKGRHTQPIDGGETVKYWLPNTLFKSIKAKGDASLSISQASGNQIDIELEYDGITSKANADNTNSTRFPSYRKLFNGYTNLEEKTSVYSAEYLARSAKIAKLISSEKLPGIRITSHYMNLGLFKFADKDFILAVMPQKQTPTDRDSNLSHSDLPEWVLDSLSGSADITETETTTEESVKAEPKSKVNAGSDMEVTEESFEDLV